MKRIVSALLFSALVLTGPAAYANPHGHDGGHNCHRHENGSYYCDPDGQSNYGGGGYNGGGQWGGGGYQQNGAYSQGYRDGYRQGTADGQQDCGYRHDRRGGYAQSEYDRGFADGYAAAYNGHCR